MLHIDFDFIVILMDIIVNTSAPYHKCHQWVAAGKDEASHACITGQDALLTCMARQWHTIRKTFPIMVCI